MGVCREWWAAQRREAPARLTSASPPLSRWPSPRPFSVFLPAVKMMTCFLPQPFMFFPCPVVTAADMTAAVYPTQIPFPSIAVPQPNKGHCLSRPHRHTHVHALCLLELNEHIQPLRSDLQDESRTFVPPRVVTTLCITTTGKIMAEVYPLAPRSHEAQPSLPFP